MTIMRSVGMAALRVDNPDIPARAAAAVDLDRMARVESWVARERAQEERRDKTMGMEPRGHSVVEAAVVVEALSMRHHLGEWVRPVA